MKGLVLRPMEPADLPWVRLQPAQRILAREMTPATGELLRQTGLAFTALEHARPIACAGLIFSMGPPAIGWAVFSKAAGRHFVKLTSWVRFLLAGLDAVETGVDPDFLPGQRWARCLGFKPTGRPVERWESSACELWQRINDHGA